MARRRWIDPTFWDDPDVGDLTPEQRLFFIGCFSNADDEGRLLGSPAYLRGTIFKYDQISLAEVQSMRDAVVATMNGSLVLYEEDGREYLAFTSTWGRYQNPSHAKESKLPVPPGVKGGRRKEDGKPTERGRKEDAVGRVGLDGEGKDWVEDKEPSLVKHWAVQCYRHVVHKHLKTALREEWVAFAEQNYTDPDEDANFQSLKADIKAFMAKGWYEGNVDWLMKWVESGKPEKWANGKSKQEPQLTPEERAIYFPDS